MPISKQVQRYLTAKDIPFELVHHRPGGSAAESALNAKIPLMSLAKAVILSDHQGLHLMAVIPGSNKVKLNRMEKITRSNLSLAPEDQLESIFKDCDITAIPAIGPAFNILTWYDICLLEHDKLYIESGDHQCLIELSRNDFINAMESSFRGSISELAGGEIQL